MTSREIPEITSRAARGAKMATSSKATVSTLQAALAEVEAHKTASRRARDEVGDMTHLLLQARAENASLKRQLERCQSELRELNSALTHFEDAAREELDDGITEAVDPQRRRLTRQRLERALAEEQEAHRATRRQLELCKLTAAEREREWQQWRDSKEGRARDGKEGKRWGMSRRPWRDSPPPISASENAGGRKQDPSIRRNSGGPIATAHDGDYDGEKEAMLSLSLEEKREEMERSAGEYRNIILMLSEEVETLKSQLSVVTRSFEDHFAPPQLIALATGEDGSPRNGNSAAKHVQPQIRLVAAKTLANLAAREERRPEIARCLPGLLRALHRDGASNKSGLGAINGESRGGAIQSRNGGAKAASGTQSDLERLMCATVANLSVDAKYQGEVVRQGGLEVLHALSLEAEDSQTLRMAAGAYANLCANAVLKEDLGRRGVAKAMIEMQRTTKHPDVQAQLARGLCNWVLSNSGGVLGRGVGVPADSSKDGATERAGTSQGRGSPFLESFVADGGVACLLRLAESREADLVTKKHVGTALYHTLQEIPETTRRHIAMSPSGIRPLVDMTRCAERTVAKLAEALLELINEPSRSRLDSHARPVLSEPSA